MSIFDPKVATLNARISSIFGDESAVTFDRGTDIALLEVTGVVWLESDTAGEMNTVRVQCPMSVFAGLLPKKGSKVTRNGIIYRIQEPEQQAGDWISIKARRLAPNEI